MDETDNGKEDLLHLNLTRGNLKALSIKNMIGAGVLTRDEAARYEKVLDSFTDLQLIRLWLLSCMYWEGSGEIISP